MNFAELANFQTEDRTRRAALMLHALPQLDRNWLLSQLPKQDQALLMALVDELVHLGIPPNREFVEQALGATSAPMSVDVEIQGAALELAFAPTLTNIVPTTDTDIEYFENLTAARKTCLLGVLSHEPPLLIARLMQMRPWSWSDSVRVGLHTELRKQVDNLLVSPEVFPKGPILENALLRVLRARCEDIPAAVPEALIDGTNALRQVGLATRLKNMLRDKVKAKA